MTPKPPAVLLVTHLPIGDPTANGFSARYRILFESLQNLWPTAVISFSGSTGGPGNNDVLGACTIEYPELVNPLDGVGLWADGRRLLHYLFGRYPYRCIPPRRFPMDFPAEEMRAPLVLLLHPHLAHLSPRLGTVPHIVFLEEGVERQVMRDLGGKGGHLGPLKRAAGELEARRYQQVYRRAGRAARLVVAISELERVHFGRWVPDEKLRVIPHAVDCEFFRPIPTDEAARDIDVLVVGQLGESRYSSIPEIMRAVDASPGYSGRFRWALVGGSPPPGLRALASQRVLVTGSVDDVRPFYARARTVLVPAFGDEGAKTTLLQAWAMGRSVVTTREAIRAAGAVSADAALVGDRPGDLAAHLVSLLGDSGARTNMETRGRKLVLERFSNRRLGAQFEALCRELLDERAVAPESGGAVDVLAPHGEKGD